MRKGLADEPIESAPAAQREEVAASAEPAKPAQDAHLIVICRAKETGAPLAGQDVHLAGGDVRNGAIPQASGAQGKLNEIVTTGADGRAEFVLGPGIATDLSVYPKRPGANASATRTLAPLAPGERREVVLELATQEDARFFGRVIARETRKPVPGAALHGEPRLHFTDEDGRFDVSFASWSRKSIEIVAPGFGKARIGAQPGHDTPESALVIELERSSTLIAILRDAGTHKQGETLGLRVVTEAYRLQSQDPLLLSGNNMDIGEHSWRAEFDAAGRAEIADLLPGAPLRISVIAGKARLLELSAPVTLAPGETRELPIELAQTCVLSGRVHDAQGKASAGVVLWLLRAGTSPRLYLQPHERKAAVATATSDAEGRFSFPKVAPGAWRLGPEAKFLAHGQPIPADAVAPLAIAFEIQPGESTREVDLVVHRGLTIAGRVVDPAGQPARESSVNASGLGLWIFASCDEQGAFEIGPLAPGSYSVEADPFPGPLANSEPVAAEAGARGLVLRLRRGARLAGRVVDATSGKGVVAQVAVSVPGDKTAPIHMPTSKPDGSFELDGLLPATYALAAAVDDGRVGLLRGVALSAGADLKDLVIEVHAGGRVRVRYEGAQGFCSAQVEQDGIVLATDGVETGTARTFPAPAGASQLVCQIGGDGKRIVRELALQPGEERELVIRDED